MSSASLYYRTELHHKIYNNRNTCRETASDSRQIWTNSCCSVNEWISKLLKCSDWMNKSCCAEDPTCSQKGLTSSVFFELPTVLVQKSQSVCRTDEDVKSGLNSAVSFLLSLLFCWVFLSPEALKLWIIQMKPHLSQTTERQTACASRRCINTELYLNHHTEVWSHD